MAELKFLTIFFIVFGILTKNGYMILTGSTLACFI